VSLYNQYQTHTLEAIRVGMQQYLPEEVVRGIEVEQVTDSLYHFGAGVAFQFHKDLWADKLADETVKVKAVHMYDRTIPVWTSAWQLWKHNHRDSKLFGWVSRKWPPVQEEQRFVDRLTPEVEVHVKKYLTFPEFQPPAGNMGPYYRYITVNPTGRVWWE